MAEHAAPTAGPGEAGPGEAGPGEAGPSPASPGPASSGQVLHIPCVGAVIKDQSGRLLMILRGHEPGKGLWSIPGGRVEAGETDPLAVVREVREETGLEVICGPLLGSAELPGLAGSVVDVKDYLAFVVPGSAAEVTAGDDAAAVRWVTDAEADAMEERGELTPGLLTALRSWA